MAENILHYNAVRLRLQGIGDLDITLLGLDDVITSNLKPLPMSLTPGREPLRLANFKGQRVRVRVGTDKINEKFIINRIILYTKELWTSYPG